jgi:hypothetical protein
VFTIKGLLLAAIGALSYFAVGLGDASTSSGAAAVQGYYPDVSLPTLFHPMER